MKKLETNLYKIEIVGHTQPNLFFRPQAMWRSGNIRDGISLQHGDEGVWLIAYGDLVQMLRLARRERTKETAGRRLSDDCLCL